MNVQSRSGALRASFHLFASLLFATSVDVQAADVLVDQTTIAQVSVSGGADTTNPGTTCIVITSPVSAVCTGTWVAIPNNNKQLIAAALASKMSGSRVWLYYNDAAPSGHCPGLAFTPCSVISISTK